MVNRGSRAAVALMAAVLVLVGCRPEGGVADLVNESGDEDLSLVMIDSEGREWLTTPLEDVSYLDTEFFDREVQCYVGTDGYFEVREANGDVFASHDYTDKPVCDGDEIILGPGGSLTWR